MTRRPALALIALSALGLGSVAAEPGKPAPSAPSPAPAATPAAAGTLQFDFADLKGVNGVAFSVDSTLEPITGFAGGVSGKIDFNPADPKSLAGQLSIPTEKLSFPNEMMTKVALGEDFLNAKVNSAITVKIKSVKEAKPGVAKGASDVQAVADITVAGLTKEQVIPVTATYHAGRLGDRMQGAKGDLLILRSTFKINRSDFNLKPGQMTDLVGEQIEVRAAIAGARKDA